MNQVVPEFDPAQTLILATANRKKAGELITLMQPRVPSNIRLLTLADLPPAPDVDETGTTFAENAQLKATQQARRLGGWVIGDDSGLAVDALGGRPGVYSARYAGLGASDADNRQLLIKEMTGVPTEKRTAQFVCFLALAAPDGTIRAMVDGACHGRIRESESGSGGFGYDPLFEIVEYHRTFGVLAPEVKGVLSHRARAVEAMARHINSLIASGQWGICG